MKIFLAGAVSSAQNGQLEKYNIYKDNLAKIFRNALLITPNDIWEYRNNCIHNNSQLSQREIDNMMVNYDLEKVRESDLIVCDLSELSTGMGLELGVAHENHKKVVFFYETGAHISSMIIGAFSDSLFVEYASVSDLRDKLLIELKNVKY